MKKSNNVIMIILIILVLGLVGYIVYDKTLSINNTSNNNGETNNTNNNNNEQTPDNNDNDYIYDLKTLKTYAGCSKEPYQSNAVSFQYARYILEIKESNKCVLYYGGINQNSSGSIMPTFECVSEDSYIKINHQDIPLFFKLNSNDTITYQNVNVIMKKVDSPENADYDFCKNNY